MLAVARQKDEEEARRTGFVPNDLNNDVRIDASNEETLGESMSKITANWSEEKKLKFNFAVGRCVAQSGRMDEPNEADAMRCLHGMTADEIFVKASRISDAALLLKSTKTPR